MIPTAPLENHILGGIQFLDNQARNGGGLLPALDDLAHIHGFVVISHQQGIAVRQELQIVQIGDIAIAGLVGIKHLIMGIQHVEG